ncbi:MAG: polysaccharide deacetylase family protein [Desulfobulbaceae bacterium]|nr:polysaccharide deacetylase family protein [Desulfobulbaceae bacterium]
MTLSIKAKAAFRKNIPWLTGLVLGRYPAFVRGKNTGITTPVFIFHQVDENFEHFLRYLSENGYQTLNADEYCLHCADQTSRGDKKVVLTFDDGHISLWTHAYPLLRKYGLQAVSFICPGLVPEPLPPGSDAEHILCDWNHISLMHHSGTIDFQLHGMFHNLVFTSHRISDFFHPAFRSHYLGKREQALILRDGDSPSLTNLWPDQHAGPPDYLGMPIYPLAPKYGTNRRYRPDPELIDRLVNLVAQHGGPSFFEQKGWHSIMNREFRRISHNFPGKTISGSHYQEELADDLLTGKNIMEQRLPGKKIRHFCFPWYKSTTESLRTAASCGFTSGFLGPDIRTRKNQGESSTLIRIQRLPAQYLLRLPGKNRMSLLQVIAKTL